VVTAGAAILCAAVGIATLPGAGEAQKQKGKKEQRDPNIVLVMTDDQTVESMRVMPRVEDKLAESGVTFRNSFASFPVCCPSRATMLTGQYPDNHGVRTNQPPGGGYAALGPTIGNTLPVWLQKAGYYTAHIGKFLNGYGRTSLDTDVPPGWSEWYGSLDDPDGYTGGTYSMYGYTLNENGAIVHYGTTPEVPEAATYQTDVYSAKAQDFVERRAPSRKPFYLSVATLAPHSEGGAPQGNNPRAAPRHEGVFASEPVPRPPSFDEADVSDKPADIRNLNPITAQQEAQIDARYRARLESLLAVDELVGALVEKVKAEGELKNTYFIFTSDNGFFHGEHRVRNGKVRHYEESSKVPLVIRGPDIPKDKVRDQLAANIDLAPTIADIAGAKPKRKTDGDSLLPLAEDGRLEPGRGILIEAFNNADDEDPDGANLRYSAVRTDRYVYAETGAEQELYDLSTDPFELTSRHADPSLARVKAALDELLAELTSCAGGSCAAKPKLKLKLRCKGSGLKVQLAGGDSGEVTDVDSKRRDGKRVSVNATMLDGRVATVSDSVPRRC
jgi:arylsulfatase A-like enzyme